MRSVTCWGLAPSYSGGFLAGPHSCPWAGEGKHTCETQIQGQRAAPHKDTASVAARTLCRLLGSQLPAAH